MKNFLEALGTLAPFLNQVPLGVQFIDDEMRYRYLNPEALRHGRSTAEQLIGRTMEECYPGIEKTKVYERILRVSRTGKNDAFENAFTFPDGSQKWFELCLYCMPRGVIVTSVDITKRKNLELHVRHAERMEAAGQLAGGIAHDFNNLLMVISSVGDLLLESPLTEEQQHKVLDVLDAADRAALLTRKLLTLSSQIPGGPARRIDLEKFIEERRAALAAILGLEAGLRVHLAPQMGQIFIDPGALEQLLTHLVKNAAEAMNGRGTLTLTSALKDSAPRERTPPLQQSPGQRYVLLRFTDDGPGISAEVLEKIFDPFFSTKSGDSRGLGLAMCWGLVERAGGTIQVQSTKEEGTCFEVYLPVAEPEALEQVKARPSQRARPQERLRVLVVDDVSSVGKVVCGLLKRLGHVGVSASSGAEALAALSANGPFDLVVSDFLMPEMTGPELASRLREQGDTTPFIVMSGYAPDHREFVHIPPEHRLEKPFTSEQLQAAIAAALGTSAAHPPRN